MDEVERISKMLSSRTKDGEGLSNVRVNTFSALRA
jgi:hypothetical protein